MFNKVIFCLGLMGVVATVAIASNLSINLDKKVVAVPQDTQLKAAYYLELGDHKLGETDYQGALANFNEAIRLAPTSAEGYNRRARFKGDKLDNYQGALADFNEAIRLNPNYVDAYIYRSEYKEKLNDIQGALADLNEAIRRDPNNTMGYYERGLLKYRMLNDQPGAIADMKEVTRLYMQSNKTRINGQLFYVLAINQLKKWSVTDRDSGL